jgi:hypothetical protein
MAVSLPGDLLLRFTQFADRQTLAALCLVSKLFANSELLHECLFAREHPNLNLTQIQTTSWRELRVQRTLAERNLLRGLFRPESIFTPPPGAQDLIALVFQGRQFITYSINQTDPPAFFIYEVEKKKTLSFPISLHHRGISLLQMYGNLYVHLTSYNHPFFSFSLLKVGNDLTEVQQCTTNQAPIDWAWWIFCKESNSFCLAMTNENQLWISTSPTACRTKTFNTQVKIVGHFFFGERSLLMLHFKDGVNINKNIDVYDFDTLELCFSLKTPWFPIKFVKVLQEDEELVVSHSKETKAAVYEIPSFPEIPATYQYCPRLWAPADSMTIYVKAKMHYIKILRSPLWLDCKRIGLETPNSSQFTEDFVFPKATEAALCESQGLPILLASDGNQVYSMNFNFIPTFADEYAKIALKVNIFIRRFWPAILFGLLALFFCGTILKSFLPQSR